MKVESTHLSRPAFVYGYIAGELPKVFGMVARELLRYSLFLNYLEYSSLQIVVILFRLVAKELLWCL